MSATFLVGRTQDVVESLPDGSVDLVLTSPPFLALRSYLPDDHPDKAAEIGSESTPAEFVNTLLGLTELWGRKLAPHGSIAIELGDTYSGSGGAGGDYNEDGLRDGQAKFSGSAAKRARLGVGDNPRPPRSGRTKPSARRDRAEVPRSWAGGDGWPLPKSLSLIPEAYRIALAYGINPLTGEPSPAGRWRVRNVVDWCRPNPAVGTLGDKYRPSTSDLVIACRARDRWFDLDAVRGGADNVKDQRYRNTNGQKCNTGDPAEVMTANYTARVPSHPGGAPPLDHWIIPPGGFKGAHYAVYPPELCRIPIESMCPRRVCRTCGKPSRRIVEREPVGGRKVATKNPGREARAGRITTQDGGEHFDGSIVTTTGWTSCGCPETDGIKLDGYHTGEGWRPGLVLDPFGGSGTTAVVATGLSRDCILVDLDERNVALAQERLGMFLEVAPEHPLKEVS